MACRDRLRSAVANLGLLAVTVLVGLAVTRDQANALTITPSFDSSITAAPDAGAIESSINTVINTYERLFADPIDVTIFFQRAPLPNDLASQSKASLYAVGYFVYAGQMIVDAVFNDNPVLTTAVINLASGNKSDQIVATSAGLRALGFTDTPGLLGTDGERFHGTLDGVITLDSGTDFQYSRPVSPDSIDARWAIAHEINEVLGVGGAGGSILNAAFDSGQVSPPFFGGVIGGEDLFRYAAPGIPSLTLDFGRDRLLLDRRRQNGFGTLRSGSYLGLRRLVCPRSLPTARAARRILQRSGCRCDEEFARGGRASGRWL